MSMIARRSLLKGGAVTLIGGLLSEASPTRAPSAQFRLGVNLAGAEFAKIGGRWRWPNVANLDYYLSKGFNVFRVPFKWNRLQPTLDGPLDRDALDGLDVLIRRATAAGAVILLDAHDYGRRDGQIIAQAGSTVGAAPFASFWGLLATRYKANPHVWYNLMNEPHDQDPMANLAAQNAACAAIRAAGATSKVLFSGSAWSGAHSWLKTANAKVMLLVRDPGNNYAFDAHQYLDKRYNGGSLVAVPGLGARVLNDIYGWASENRKKIFLGEFAAGPNAASLAELDALLSFMVRHKDVFIGATYFAGGGTWGKSVGSADPVEGVEKPQTLLLQRYLSR